MEFLLYPCLQMIWCFNNERRAYHSFSSFFFLKTYLTDRNLGLTVTSSAQKVSSFAFLLRSFPLASTFCSRYVGSIYGWKTFTWNLINEICGKRIFQFVYTFKYFVLKYIEIDIRYMIIPIFFIQTKQFQSHFNFICIFGINCK